MRRDPHRPSEPHRVGLEGDTDSRVLFASLKSETARVRALAAECRGAGVFLEDLPEELEHIRGLLRDGKLGAALEHLQVLRLDLLGRLVVQEAEPMPLLDGTGAPHGAPVSEEELAVINDRIARITAAARSRLTLRR